jgi:hypothetical protein
MEDMTQERNGRGKECTEKQRKRQKGKTKKKLRKNEERRTGRNER